MRYLFITIVLLAIVVLTIVSMPTEEPPTGRYVLADESVESDGRVCCTFMQEGHERTCAVVEDESCDACMQICGVT